MRHKCFHAFAATAFLLIALPAAHAATSSAIAKAVADPARSADDKAADALRKPAETLAFAGVQPGQVVADYLPGGGYFTVLLSDVAGPKGKVYSLPTTAWGNEKYIRPIAATHKNVRVLTAPLGTFTVPEKLDLFWTSQNYHDLHDPKRHVDVPAFDRMVFAALKPGGIFLVLDHAAAAGSGFRDCGTLHRIDKQAVITEVEAAGFKLAGESDVLHNPADDHTRAVFDKSIRGHTDQFILKFRKPA